MKLLPLYLVVFTLISCTADREATVNEIPTPTSSPVAVAVAAPVKDTIPWPMQTDAGNQVWRFPSCETVLLNQDEDGWEHRSDHGLEVYGAIGSVGTDLGRYLDLTVKAFGSFDFIHFGTSRPAGVTEEMKNEIDSNELLDQFRTWKAMGKIKNFHAEGNIDGDTADGPRYIVYEEKDRVLDINKRKGNVEVKRTVTLVKKKPVQVDDQVHYFGVKKYSSYGDSLDIELVYRESLKQWYYRTNKVCGNGFGLSLNHWERVFPVAGEQDEFILTLATEAVEAFEVHEENQLAYVSLLSHLKQAKIEGYALVNMHAQWLTTLHETLKSPILMDHNIKLKKVGVGWDTSQEEDFLYYPESNSFYVNSKFQGSSDELVHYLSDEAPRLDAQYKLAYDNLAGLMTDKDIAGEAILDRAPMKWLEVVYQGLSDPQLDQHGVEIKELVWDRSQKENLRYFPKTKGLFIDLYYEVTPEEIVHYLLDEVPRLDQQVNSAIPPKLAETK